MQNVKEERKQIQFGSKQDTLIGMAEGNPGAINVLCQLCELNEPESLSRIIALDDMNIRGTQIWVGYKDHCKSNIKNFAKAIDDRDPDMLETINKQGKLGNHPPYCRYQRSVKRSPKLFQSNVKALN